MPKLLIIKPFAWVHIISTSSYYIELYTENLYKPFTIWACILSIQAVISNKNGTLSGCGK